MMECFSIHKNGSIAVESELTSMSVGGFVKH